jgi:hypothetical protein
MEVNGMSIEAMKQALEALETPIHAQPFGLKQKAITALQVAIEAAEKQEPVEWEDVLGAIARGWTHPENAQKPMDVQLAVAIAKEIQDMYTTPPAAQQEPDAYGYAKRLAEAIWQKHYKATAPQWKPLDDLMGVLTQIDNMTAGLTAQRQPLTDEKIDDIWNRYCDEMGEASINDACDIARAIEAAHGIKENT